MSTQAQSTVGTRIVITDLLASPHVPLTVPALKGFSPAGGGKRKKIDKSTMDDKAYNANQGGRIDPAEATGEIVLLKSLAGHQKLKSIMEAQASGAVGNFRCLVLDSDGVGAATMVTNVLTPPTTASPKHWACSGEWFDGYISNLSPKYADDDVIRADFSIQIDGASTWFNKGDLKTLTY